MNRASSAPAARATDRLLSSRRCNCDDHLDTQRRVHAAKEPLVAAIVRLVEIASSPTSAAGLALTDCRRALSVLESGDE